MLPSCMPDGGIKPMRVFVLNTDHLRLLGEVYRRNPGLESRDYDAQYCVLSENFVGERFSYITAFNSLGHVAMTVSANNAPLQAAWARGHGHVGLARAVENSWMTLSLRQAARRVVGRLGHVPMAVLRGADAGGALAKILLAQIEDFRPDVLLNQDMFLVGRPTLQQIKKLGIRVVGQHAASSLPTSVPLDEYDLLVSSFPPTLDKFRALGLPASLNRLAFDPEILTRFRAESRSIRWPVTFVGSLQSVHSSRVEFLEDLARLVPALRLWTPDQAVLPRRSLLRKRFMGTVAGLDMYEVLRSSFVTINHHGDIAPHANNMRLFEATGVGSVLATDTKKDLSDLFIPGVELLAYSSAEECADLIAALGQDERERIARAGQRRTLSEHTYLARVEELVGLFDGLCR
jgi:spore maturation protein CgeB